MDEQIAFLLLSPFQDIIEKAQVAVDNARAADNDEMLKAAQALLKEGERSRKTLDGVAQRQLKTYAENFIAALGEAKDITDPVDELTALVYDLDDYTEPETFDADKYKEYAKAAQKTTMAILPLLRRMKIDALLPTSLPVASPSISTGSGFMRVNSQRSNPSVHTDNSDRFRDELIKAWAGAAPGSLAPGDDVPQMGAMSGPDLGFDNGTHPVRGSTSSAASPGPGLRSISEPAPKIVVPPAPATNPWQIGPRPSVSTITEDEELSNIINFKRGDDGAGLDDADGSDRRSHVSTASRPDSPTIPSPTSAAPDYPVAGALPTPANAPALPMHTGRKAFALPLPPPPISSRLADEEDSWGIRRPVTSSSRGQAAGPKYSIMPPARQGMHSYTHASAAMGQSSRDSRISTATASTVSSSANGSVFSSDSAPHGNGNGNGGRESALDPISPTGKLSASPDGQAGLGAGAGAGAAGGLTAQLLASFASGGAQTAPGPPQAHAAHAYGARTMSQSAPFTQQMSPVPRHMSLPTASVDRAYDHSYDHAYNHASDPIAITRPVMDFDSGLIPVESPTGTAKAGSSSALTVHRNPDCIIGPGSAFHLLKGFCEGAKEVQRGERGVRQIRKLSYSGSGAYAAKCTHCLYELQWTEIEKDRQCHPSANYRMQGIAFRLRFLSKSHLPAKQVDDPLYACLFCLQQGHTLEESDATVFFSQGQLFAHLARHPRPLPPVPGIRVIDGEEAPAEYRYNYDLHFTNPPVPSDLVGIRPELDRLPTGTSIDTFRKSHGTLRRPFDGSMPVQFPAGSKLVGIEFPAKYKGEWAVGWFDNIRGPFPVESVRLEPPPRGEMPTQTPSGLRATARWKWGNTSAYKNSEWLKMDRNETITDIIFSHPDHWCWAGKNSKGKWGYFPQSHIEPNSLIEPGGGEGSSSVGSERVGPLASATGTSSSSGGFFSRLRSSGPPPVTASTRRPMSISSHSTASSR